MDITYLGHSSFKIKGKGATIVTDPFDAEMVGLKYPKLTEVDIVTVSHDHKDHNFLENVKDSKMVIDTPGEYEISGVSIIGISTYHDDKKGEIRGKNTIFVLEIDGMRIVHLGDLGHKLSQDMVEDLGSIDIMMVPVGGNYTIDGAVAAEVVRSVEPSIVLPMHYKVPGLKVEVSPIDDFLKQSGMIVENSEKLSVKKLDISETETKVVVLEVKS